MTDKQPSEKAMAAARAACGCDHGKDSWGCMTCGRDQCAPCLRIARALDDFAEAARREQNAEAQAVFDALGISLRSNPVTKTAWLEADESCSSDGEAVAAYRAIAARRRP